MDDWRQPQCRFEPKFRERNAMSQTLRNILAALILSLPWSGATGFAQQAPDYPNRPIKLILPAAAGGPTDVPARLASQILSARLGQPVVVENRPGAGGALAARIVAAAP